MAVGAAVRQLGYTLDELRGHTVLSLQKDVVGPAQWESIAQAIRETGSQFLFAGCHRHKSGAEVPVEVASSYFESGGRRYVLSIARDTSRRQALERAQGSREAQLHFALTEASDGLWDWDVVKGLCFLAPSSSACWVMARTRWSQHSIPGRKTSILTISSGCKARCGRTCM